MNLWVSDHDPAALDFNQESFDAAYVAFEPYFQELGVEKPGMPQRYHPAFEEQVDALLEAQPPVFSFVFGVPPAAVLRECRRRGIITIGTATTVAEAELLDSESVDLIVASGFEAGGHRTSFLGPPEVSLMGTFSLTQLVARRVESPVVSAGGIVDGSGVRAALALGASAAQIGTAFLACEESGTTDDHRALLLEGGADDTTLTRAYSGRLARGVRNRWIDDWPRPGTPIAPFPVQSFFFSKIKSAAMEAGRTDLMPLYASQSAPNLRHPDVKSLMVSILADLDSAPGR